MKNGTSNVVLSRMMLQEFYECRNLAGLADEKRSKKVITAYIKEAKFSFKSCRCEKFPGVESGFSYIAVIGESSVELHSWPERDATLQLTVHYCNYKCNNNAKARTLFRLIKQHYLPRRVSKRKIINRYKLVRSKSNVE